MTRVAVLDHGYIEVIESWGSDERIVETARVSTQKGFIGWGPAGYRCSHVDSATARACGFSCGTDRPERCPECGDGLVSVPGDEKLLRYLTEHNHSTPFEFAGMTIEVQAPIFVFREWHRHRTQSYSEASARYASLPDCNYIPTAERCLSGAGAANRQAGSIKGSPELTPEVAERWRALLDDYYKSAESMYQVGLSVGIPKELARLVLPSGRYSKMRASANLRNWLGFLRLRMDSSAQWEIRQYANAVGEAIANRFPRTWELFQEGRGK